MTNNDVSRVSLCERSRTDSRKNVGPWNLLPYCFAAVLGHSAMFYYMWEPAGMVREDSVTYLRRLVVQL